MSHSSGYKFDMVVFKTPREQINALIDEKNELIAALEEIANTACGEASHQYIALVALAKLGADKGEK